MDLVQLERELCPWSLSKNPKCPKITETDRNVSRAASPDSAFSNSREGFFELRRVGFGPLMDGLLVSAFFVSL